MVEEAPRRADDDGGPGAEGAQLVAVAAATRHRDDRELHRREQPGELLLDLLRELAGRRDDDRARLCALVDTLRVPVWIGGRLGRSQGVAQGVADRDGLSGPGLRADPEIAPFELGREDRFLDGR